MAETVAEVVAKAIKKQIADNYNEPQVQKDYYRSRISLPPVQIEGNEYTLGAEALPLPKEPLRNDVTPDDVIVIIKEEGNNISVRVRANGESKREHFDPYADLDASMDMFADVCEPIGSTTFRPIPIEEGEGAGEPFAYLQYQANNWLDMINALNLGLSESNKIDTKILGKGV